MPQQLPIPKVIDLRPARRPGGAQGAPRPDTSEWPAGTKMAAWLTSGDCIHLETGDRTSDPSGLDGDLISWSLISWWIPI